MGCCRNGHVTISLLFLLISSMTHVGIKAGGRKHIDSTQKGREEGVVMARALIGSRPPRCDRRCRTCGHCEAIQVPVFPTLKNQEKSSYHFPATPTVAYSRGDDTSNYKPMYWKCKCGDFIFDP